ncbi:MAG: hypothetical protein L0Y70_04890 [Gemmataceae bacterium]|nr:hypothetical protein [Gemmataceae bacterium]
MSATLKEFLHEKAQKHQAEMNAGKAIVDEWRTSIEQLFRQIREWLKESDPQGLIEIEENQAEIKEPGLGFYRVPRLDFRAFGKWIGIIPKARNTVGTANPPQKSAPKRAEGRVDIRRYVLYRFKEDGRDTWLIDGLERGYEDSEKAWPGQVSTLPRSEPRPLDQEALEKALMSYLR